MTDPKTPQPTLTEYRVPAKMMQALVQLTMEQPAGRVLDLAVDLVQLVKAQEAAGDPLPPAPPLPVMVDRFLAWKLPAGVHTDGHTHVAPAQRAKDWVGSGTNLLNADQAAEMLQHVLGLQP